MKKFFAALLVLVTLVIAVPGLVNASNWTKEQEPTTCWICGGSGSCSSCGGKGYVEEYGSDEEAKCEDCNGTGNCSNCGGNGEV